MRLSHRNSSKILARKAPKSPKSNYSHGRAAGIQGGATSGLVQRPGLFRLSPPISNSRSGRPLAEDFFSLFAGDLSNSDHWSKVNWVRDLRPGDLIAWLLPEGSQSRDTGHTMIVEGVLKIDGSIALVRVIDSTVSPHMSDSRPAGTNGLGTGIIGIALDSAERAIGFLWRGSESTKIHYTDIAFGRLLK